MANSTVAIDEPATIDKRVQTYSGTVATLTVEREAMVVSDPVTFGDTNEGIARVLNAAPASTDYGLVVRDPTGTTAALAAFAKITDGTDTALVTAGGLLQVDASGAAVPVTDNAGTLTVDAPVGTPVAVRVSDGAAFYELPVGQGSNAAISARGVFIAGQYDDTGPTLPAEDQASAVRISAQRSLYVQLRSGTADIGATTATPLIVRLSDGTDLSLISAAGALIVDGSAVTQPVSGTVTANQGGAPWTAVGNVAHDVANAASNNPSVGGMEAIAHGTNPTAVAAADVTKWYANRAGVPFVIGGHPNVITLRATYSTAQTDTAIVTIGAGSKIVVTKISATCDKANTADLQVRVGFGAVNTPTTTGVLLSHAGVAAGSGVIEGSGAGILGVGADGEDLRITTDAAQNVDIVVSYYTIES